MLLQIETPTSDKAKAPLGSRRLVDPEVTDQNFDGDN
jgi:hypothetical protein